jgi:hypothetical protein
MEAVFTIYLTVSVTLWLLWAIDLSRDPVARLSVPLWIIGTFLLLAFGPFFVIFYARDKKIT